jgi:hypothetical protein
MTRRALFVALLLCALAGLMLHYRIHNFMIQDPLHPGRMIFDSTRFLSFIFPLVDVILVTALFLSRRTAVYGYLLNGLIVIYGTLFMAQFSIAELLAKSIPPQQWLLKSTLPDIALAWVDFFIGYSLYQLTISGKETPASQLQPQVGAQA